MATATTTRKRPTRREDMPDPLAPTPAAPQQQELSPDPTAKPERLVTVYSPIEQGLALLREKHGGVLTAKPVVTIENLDAVKTSHKELVTFRTRLEAARKTEKEESLKYGRLVDSEAARIQAVASPIEKVYKDALDEWEQAEQRRKDALIARIKELRETPARLLGATVEQLEQSLEAIKTFPLAELLEFREAGAQAQFQAQQGVDQLLLRAREAERQRLIGQERVVIDAIRSRAAQVRTARRSATLEALIGKFELERPDPAKFAHLGADATTTFETELAGLRTLLAERKRTEEQDAENARLREQLATMQAQQAAAAPPPAVPEPAATPSQPQGAAFEFPSHAGDHERAVADAGEPDPFASAPAAAVAKPEVRTSSWPFPVNREQEGKRVARFVSGSTVRTDPVQPPAAGHAEDVPPLDAEDVALVAHLADHLDEPPLAVLARLERLDFQTLRDHFGQRRLDLSQTTTTGATQQ